MSFYGTPLDDLDAADAADPGWALPRVMKAGFLLEPDRGRAARRARRRGSCSTPPQPPPARRRDGRRERAHLAALRRCSGGRLGRRPARRGRRCCWRHPRDALALQWAHLFDFYRGDAAEPARSASARVLPEWDEDDPLHPHVLALHAFGLEENASLRRGRGGRPRARSAAEPKVPWAIHAVAHVMEMQGRHAEGAPGCARCAADWARGNGFSVPPGLAPGAVRARGARLRRRAGAVRRAPARRPGADHAAAARRGVAAVAPAPAGRRRRPALAARCSTAGRSTEAAAGHYAFNDLHALLALHRRRRPARARGAGWRACAERAEARAGTNRAMARDVGLPLMHGLLAFAERRCDDAATSTSTRCARVPTASAAAMRSAT